MFIDHTYPSVRLARGALTRFAEAIPAATHAAFVAVTAAGVRVQLATRQQWRQVFPACREDLEAYHDEELPVVVAVGRTVRIMPLSQLERLEVD